MTTRLSFKKGEKPAETSVAKLPKLSHHSLQEEEEGNTIEFHSSIVLIIPFVLTALQQSASVDTKSKVDENTNKQIEVNKVHARKALCYGIGWISLLIL